MSRPREGELQKRNGVGNNKARNPMGDFGPFFPPEAEGHGHDSAIAGSSHKFEQRMQHEGFQHRHFAPHDFFQFVRIFFTTTTAARIDRLRQHPESGIGIALPEQDFVPVPSVPFVWNR
jgi:hypothetical protein